MARETNIVIAGNGDIIVTGNGEVNQTGLRDEVLQSLASQSERVTTTDNTQVPPVVTVRVKNAQGEWEIE